MSNINKRLFEERHRLAFNKSQMASAGGVVNTAYANYESGLRSPDANFLAEIAKYGADIAYIVTGVRSENTAHCVIEMAYLRNCRALATVGKHQAGLTLLSTLRKAIGIELYPDQLNEKPKNEL